MSEGDKKINIRATSSTVAIIPPRYWLT